MPTGVLGLVVSGLIAASMSSVDSGFNAISLTWQRDICNKKSSSSKTRIVQTFLFSMLSLLMALLFMKFFKDKSLFAIMAQTINAFVAPLLIIVLAGMLSTRIKIAKGALFYAAILGFIFSIFSCYYIQNISIHYYAFLNFLVTIVVYFVLSKLFRRS